MSLTQQQFVDAYCERSKMSWADLSKWSVCLPCRCPEEECEGWAMVPFNEESMGWHNFRDGPQTQAFAAQSCFRTPPAAVADERDAARLVAELRTMLENWERLRGELRIPRNPYGDGGAEALKLAITNVAAAIKASEGTTKGET
jgi:hypothetical protein